MPVAALPIPLWQAEGFAGQPELLTADALTVIHRVTGHASTNPTGNCFFVPAAPTVDVHSLPAIELEYNLNAGIWGNGFQRLHTYGVRPGVRYWRGPVAHVGLVGRTAPYARFEPPASRPVRDQLLQVVLVAAEPGGNVVKRVLASDEVRVLLTARGAPQPVRGADRFVAQGNPLVKH